MKVPTKETNIRVYVTKYALTTGIYVAEVVHEQDDRYVYEGTPGKLSQQYILGRTAFETKEEAVANAKDQARRKIASLQKQLKKLEKLSNTPKLRDQ